ncbi:MAG: flagellar basal body P-ring formation protein FlgA [Paracoccaceae bacterium]|nr:MAG: flagellar basal body P-ring formation protein FlgA [Paracoccaceae bacterium]
MRWICLLFLLSGPAVADSLVASRTIRAAAVIGPEDVALSAADQPGALSDPADAVGLEARVTIFAGRAIRAGDLALPAVVERNQIVPLLFRSDGLVIQTEGRALGRGAVGDTLRAMNLTSRVVVAGRVAPDGTIRVGDR